MQCDFTRRGPVRRDVISLLRNISPAFRQLADQHAVRSTACTSALFSLADLSLIYHHRHRHHLRHFIIIGSHAHALAWPCSIMTRKQVFRPPFLQISTDLDEVWQESVVTRIHLWI